VPERQAKSEIRISKFETNSNRQSQNTKLNSASFDFVSWFGFSDLFRNGMTIESLPRCAAHEHDAKQDDDQSEQQIGPA
jgi:hypothetical protein